MDDTLDQSSRPVAGADDAQDPAVRLREVIEQIRSAADPEGAMVALEPALRQARDGWRDVRRLLVSPFIRDGRLEPAITALSVLIAVHPTRVEDRRLLASLFGRTKQWDRAIAEADAAAGIEPDNAALHGVRIQLRVQAGRVAEAAEVALVTLGLA